MDDNSKYELRVDEYSNGWVATLSKGRRVVSRETFLRIEYSSLPDVVKGVMLHQKWTEARPSPEKQMES